MSAATRLPAALHVVLGVAFVGAGGRIADAAGVPRAGWVLRVLGVRHLIEAPLAGRRSRRWALLACGVDGLHASSMLALAWARPGARQAALVDAGVAGVLSAGELAEARALGRSR